MSLMMHLQALATNNRQCLRARPCREHDSAVILQQPLQILERVGLVFDQQEPQRVERHGIVRRHWWRLRSFTWVRLDTPRDGQAYHEGGTLAFPGAFGLHRSAVELHQMLHDR